MPADLMNSDAGIAKTMTDEELQQALSELPAMYEEFEKKDLARKTRIAILFAIILLISLSWIAYLVYPFFR